jgi:hypothetical protein
MPDFIQYFLFVGFAGLMFLLRLDARRFGAAEWDSNDGDWRVWLPRLTWYGAGLALGLIIFALHPSPVADLNLVLAPDREEALMLGLVYGLGGIAATFVLAGISRGRVTFPHPGRYPGGVLAAVGTAFFDEFLFRGVLLGLFLSLDLPDPMAVVGAALIYAGAVRASTGGRGLLALLVALAIGLAGGVLVLMTAGLAAAFMGHAITRFAMFMTMGRPPVAEGSPFLRPGAASGAGATADSRAWLIPPRGYGGGREDDGRGGSGPVRPA